MPRTARDTGGAYRRFYTPQEVANRFRVDPKTVQRWHKAGLLESITTPGNTRRYDADQVDAMLNGGPKP
jgi:excisionase family DNA binding protein